jgi:hypothetical protein
VSVGIVSPPTDYEIFSDRIAEVRAAAPTGMIARSDLDLLLKTIEDTAMQGYREMDKL